MDSDNTSAKTTAAAGDTPVAEPKKRGVWFYVALTLGIVFLLLLCCCGTFFGLLVTNEEFQTAFEESYCESLMEEDALDADFLGIC